MTSKIGLSYKAIIFTVLFLLSLWVLYQIKEIIFLVFIAFILMSALKPLTDFLEKYRVPKVVSVFTVYIIFIGLMVFIGSSIVPLLVTQSIRLGESLPNYVSTFFPSVNFDIQMLIQQIEPIGSNLVKVTFGVFSDIIALLTIFVISLYLIIERKNLESHLSNLIGEEGAKQILTIVKKVEERLGAWIRGQFALMIVIGVSAFLGLMLLGLPYVLPLALLAGLLEIVPTIGPIISAIPAVLIALSNSPLSALAVVVLYFIIHQLENQLIVPVVMKKVVGLPPLVSLLALMVGGKLAGITGVLLAIPIVVSIETILSEYSKISSKNHPL